MRTERDLRNQIAYAYEKGRKEARELVRTHLETVLREHGYSEDRIHDIMEKCCSDSN